MSPEQKAKLITDSLKKIMMRTSDQYGKAYPTVLENTKNAIPIIKSDDSRISKQQQLKRLVAAEETKLEKVVTPAQFALYQAKKQKMMAWYRSHWLTRE